MNWEEISTEPNLSISFVKEYLNQLNWYNINRHITLSKEFIQTFSKVLRWEAIAMNSSLTLELLEEIKDESFVDWAVISIGYPVTFDMYMKFQTYINHDFLAMNPYKQVKVEKTETTKRTVVGGRNVQISYKVIEEEESTAPVLRLRIKKNREKTDFTISK